MSGNILLQPIIREVWYTVRRSPDHGIHGREDEREFYEIRI